MTRVVVAGGGPAGLYFSYLWKRRHPDHDVTLFEQNPPDATFGFGVVFSSQAMDFLRADDPETADLICARMEMWSDMTLAYRGENVVIDGVGFSAIGRLDLLLILQKQARAAGVNLQYDHCLHSLKELPEHDILVVADGVNSLFRRSQEGDFLTSVSYLDEKFAWFGTTKRFETLTQTFIETPFGPFNAHHYRYSPTMSTFIVECDRATWLRADLDKRSETDSRALCEALFKDTLDGHPLVANKSLWRNFPWIWNDRWSHGKMVLLGDALHTAHYSIGSGTRLALEDATSLVNALDEHPEDIREGFAAYEKQRRPVVEKLVRAARESASWYSYVPEHMREEPLDFAYSYITRSGRIDDVRLRQMSPNFMKRYAAQERSTR